MKKLSESRLRQIIKEELEQQFENADQADAIDFDAERQTILADQQETQDNIDAILLRLNNLKKEADEAGQSLNEFFLPAMLRGGLMGLGALGLADVGGDDVDSAREYLGDVMSGEEELSLASIGDGTELWLKKMMIGKMLSVFKIDGNLNAGLANSLVKRSFGDIKELIVTRDCKLFIEFTWDAIIQWLLDMIADPLARASNTILSRAPMLSMFTKSSGYGGNLLPMMFGGLTSQELGLHFQNDENVKSFVDDKIKPGICDFIEGEMSNVSGSDITSGILRFLS